MNGKIILRLIDAALKGQADQVRMAANILSSDLQSSQPELSKQIALLSGSKSLRGNIQRANPHPQSHDSEGEPFMLVPPSMDAGAPPPVWPKDIQNTISHILKEFSLREKLLENSLEPVKTMIFTGPPGVGKTLTARWLADQLKLPFYILDIASLVSSQLGRTGKNLKSVIDKAAKSPCVLLLDEFDSIAKKRSDESDIGELKRLVTVLLQAIDSWPSTSLLIAATNHGDMLDPAIWRRFEEKITFSSPNGKQVEQYLLQLTADRSVAKLFPLFSGLSYSDIKTYINKAKKMAILEGEDMASLIVNMLIESSNIEDLPTKQRQELTPILAKANISQRKMTTILNLSRPTIKKALTEAGIL